MKKLLALAFLLACGAAQAENITLTPQPPPVITSGSTPISGGATTQVCFNSAGTIACGNANFTYDPATNSGQLNVGGGISIASTVAGTGMWYGPRGNAAIPFVGTDGAGGQLVIEAGAGGGAAMRFAIAQLDSVGSCTGGNYECGILDWQGQTNIFTIGTIAGGSGTARPIRFEVGATVPIFTLAGATPTANTCTGFSLGTGSTDTAGKLTYTSATTCSVNFGRTFTNAPACNVTPGTAASTILVTTTTQVMSVTFGTAQTAFSWTCFGT